MARVGGPKMWMKKSCIREIKHLSTNADSSTDIIVGWTKNTPKPFFLNRKNPSKTQKKTKTSRNMPKLGIHPQPEVSNPSGSIVSGWTKNTPKPNFF